MLSPQTQQEILDLFKAEAHYQPAPEIAEQISTKTIIMFVGASCQGKTTVMQTAAKLDPQFTVSGRFTTREPRPGDAPGMYTYYPNTDAGLQQIFDKIARRELVQYAINPHAMLVYGTELSDYSTDHSMSDIFASSVASVRQNKFKNSVVMSVVTQPDIWLRRFDERFPAGDPDREARRDEAIESLEWSLAQTSGHFWIENIDGRPEVAGQAVIDICLHDGAGNPGTRKLAETTVAAAKDITL